jgi:hypothetical protein
MKKIVTLIIFLTALFARRCPEVYSNKNFFDATDSYNSVYERNINTKIVGKPFYLKIFATNNGRHCKLDGVSIGYSLFDVYNNREIEGTSDRATIFQRGVSAKFVVNRAYKDVKVAFHVCSYFNGLTYKLHNYNECNNVKCKDDTQLGRCIRTIYSSDDFAIRPYRFKIYVKDYGRNLHNVKIEALDWRGRPTRGYNVSSRDLILYAKSAHKRSRLRYYFRFVNGIAYIHSLKYSDAGNIRLGIYERKGREFARIDKKDVTFITLNPNDYIGVNILGGLSKKFISLPKYFDIKLLHFPKLGYFSNDLKGAAILKFAIIAKSANNKIARSYSGDVSVDIKHDVVNGDVSSIRTQYGSFNHDEDIKFTTDSSIFFNGKMIIKLKINFDKPLSPINEVKLRIKKIIVKDRYGVKGELNINKTILFRYGRIMIDNPTILENSIVIPVKFMYYNNGWVVNDLHDSAEYGCVNKVYTNGKIEVKDIDLNKDLISEGIQNINGEILTLKRPYETTLHFDISPWLWYSKEGVFYEKPDEFNKDCNSHPCLKIKLSKKSYW